MDGSGCPNITTGAQTAGDRIDALFRRPIGMKRRFTASIYQRNSLTCFARLRYHSKEKEIHFQNR
jgi:hypothetical protein